MRVKSIIVFYFFYFFRLGPSLLSTPRPVIIHEEKKKKPKNSTKSDHLLISFPSSLSSIGRRSSSLFPLRVTQRSSRYQPNQNPPRMVDSALGPCLMAFLALRYPWAGTSIWSLIYAASYVEGVGRIG